VLFRSILDADGVDVRCSIIGDGDDRAILERRVADLGLGHCVTFIGTLPHHEVVRALTAADILLLPSVPTPTWSESQGCVLQEAMFVGTMLVASNMGGVPESVPAEMHEFLVPPGNARAIADAVHRVMAMTPEQRAMRARANRAFCERRYDIRVLNPLLLGSAMRGAEGEWAA
jgi:glycosyltransferase involved in cell wall biosynthesis